jgi:hypothetical protein
LSTVNLPAEWRLDGMPAAVSVRPEDFNARLRALEARTR